MRLSAAALGTLLTLTLGYPAFAEDPPPLVSAAPLTDPKGDGTREYALLFSLTNVFQSPFILTGYRGYGFGGQVTLSPTSALRVGLSLSRYTNPVVFEKTTVTDPTGTHTTYTQGNCCGPTSVFGANVGLDYIKKLRVDDFSPFVGVGVRLGYSSMATAYTDDVTQQTFTTTVDNSSASFGFGLAATLGLQWRLFDRLALYASYDLGLGIVDRTSSSESTTTQQTGAGAPRPTVTTKESSLTRWFNFNLGLGQGAALGCVAYF